VASDGGGEVLIAPVTHTTAATMRRGRVAFGLRSRAGATMLGTA
jgi:hypothetical protein